MEENSLGSPSVRKHRKQRFWQVIFPVIVVLLMMIGFGVFVIRADVGETSLWSDIALIWLLAPLLILALVFLAVAIVMIYLLDRLTKGIPPYTRQAQGIAFKVKSGAERTAAIAVKPVIWLKQAAATLDRIIFSLFRR